MIIMSRSEALLSSLAERPATTRRAEKTQKTERGEKFDTGRSAIAKVCKQTVYPLNVPFFIIILNIKRRQKICFWYVNKRSRLPELDKGTGCGDGGGF